MPTIGRTSSKNTYVQSVRFKKDNWTISEAKKWCKDHDYFVDGFDNSETEYRFRQYDPDDSKYSYMQFNTGLPKGIYFIVGYKK